jgi:hypothetical protein
MINPNATREENVKIQAYPCVAIHQYYYYDDYTNVAASPGLQEQQNMYRKETLSVLDSEAKPLKHLILTTWRTMI